MATITITIPDDKLDEFFTGFLKVIPLGTDSKNEPVMKAEDWVKHEIIRLLLERYHLGKQLLYVEDAKNAINIT